MDLKHTKKKKNHPSRMYFPQKKIMDLKLKKKKKKKKEKLKCTSGQGEWSQLLQVLERSQRHDLLENPENKKEL